MADKVAGRRGRRLQGQGAEAQGNEPGLTRERIAATAVGMLDANGLNGLTMRGLAEALGSGVMSLYWHVQNKEDVFDLALDSVLEYRGPTALQDWRGDIVHVLEDWRATMLRHPWSASLLPRRALGPNILVRLERLSKCLSAGGVSDTDVNAAIWSLWNYVMGATVTRAGFGPSDEDRAASQQRLAELGALYPSIEHSRLLLDDDWDGTFRRGLDFLLDGIAPKR
ncbi:TetR/AcrR family transcriptional regulator [Devosia sp.]|uniref:TetR/AcrR family transcriptional regulator n=1 Tax=Devosia sp. TaxID=1871048 RepID=UPI0025DD0ED5|nr:TetR/AcrR family transcriptional regulator [Devosia sp.]MCR6633894.1 TetR/AcrR family transcriptional regulator [Devosia sp.]